MMKINDAAHREAAQQRRRTCVRCEQPGSNAIECMKIGCNFAGKAQAMLELPRF